MDIPATCPSLLDRLIHSDPADSTDVKYVLTPANSILYKSLLEGYEPLLGGEVE
ncbi:MAG: hypothetical protein ACW97A_14105 [Candidatus Thorarchaeota archaeon]|jgi:hypothetical protein